MGGPAHKFSKIIYNLNWELRNGKKRSTKGLSDVPLSDDEREAKEAKLEELKVFMSERGVEHTTKEIDRGVREVGDKVDGAADKLSNKMDAAESNLLNTLATSLNDTDSPKERLAKLEQLGSNNKQQVAEAKKLVRDEERDAKKLRGRLQRLRRWQKRRLRRNKRLPRKRMCERLGGRRVWLRPRMRTLRSLINQKPPNQRLPNQRLPNQRLPNQRAKSASVMSMSNVALSRRVVKMLDRHACGASLAPATTLRQRLWQLR